MKTTAEASACWPREEIVWFTGSAPSDADKALLPWMRVRSSAGLRVGSGAMALAGETVASAEGASRGVSGSSASTPLPPADPWRFRPAVCGFLPFGLSRGEGRDKQAGLA